LLGLEAWTCFIDEGEKRDFLLLITASFLTSRGVTQYAGMTNRGRSLQLKRMKQHFKGAVVCTGHTTLIVF
jgi:hypothetical protein